MPKPSSNLMAGLFACALMLAPALTPSAMGLPFERELGLPEPARVQRVTQLLAIGSGATHPLMDVSGPGCITHIWMTLGEKNDPRKITLRMHWDGESEPSVEAPITDFFGVGHAAFAPSTYFATPCLSVAPRNGYNIYLPMPFRKSARITIANDQDFMLADGGGVYFQAEYAEYESLPEDVPYLHAQWRRESPAQRRAYPYTIAQAVGGGFLAGVTYHVNSLDTSDKWFHGGGDTIYLDPTTAPTVLRGVGGEDFFGQSWGSTPFISPYAGCLGDDGVRASFYRFFLEAPPRFSESMWFAFGALANEITSVAYWYQREPHAPFFRIPAPESRDSKSEFPLGSGDIPLLPEQQLDLAVIGPFAGGVDTPTPLDTVPRIDPALGLKTNYTKPYKSDIMLLESRAVRWERASTTLSWLDFAALYLPKIPEMKMVQSMPGTFAYAHLILESDQARTCALVLGHDDAVRVFVNGAPAGEATSRQGFASDTIDLALVQGRNDLLIKAANTLNTNFAAFAISISFKDTQGLSFSHLPDLPAAEGRSPSS